MPASAQSNLLQADLGKGLEDADLSLRPNMVDLPLVLDGTIFSADSLSMRGDFSQDGGNFNISYRFGKTFMGFDGHLPIQPQIKIHRSPQVEYSVSKA